MTFIVAIFCFFAISDDKPTVADTGFSTSHSGGGDSSSSSDSSSYSSSSSSSSSSLSKSSSSRKLTKEEGIIICIAMAAIWIGPIISTIISNIIRNTRTKIKNKRMSESAEKLIKQYILDFDKKQFLQLQFDNYCKMQTAWMNFKMEDVKELISDELYTMWCSQLDTLELKNEQNIMKSFKYVYGNLTDASIENGNLTVTTDYKIKARDYIVRKGTNKLIRGSKSLMEIHYEMKFRISVDHINTIDKCPSCGNVITNNTSNICPFCRSQLFVEHKDWVLTEKTCLGQK